MLDRQQTVAARINPSLLRKGLALGTVPIAAGVVRRLFVPARPAHIDMATEGRSTALRNS